MNAGLDALLERQLAIAKQADPHHCSRCGTYLDRWYCGFPRVRCMDIGKWTTCPRCGWSVRQDPPGSGVLAPHGGRNWIPCPESGQLAAPGESGPEAEQIARTERADTEG